MLSTTLESTRLLWLSVLSPISIYAYLAGAKVNAKTRDGSRGGEFLGYCPQVTTMSYAVSIIAA